MGGYVRGSSSSDRRRRLSTRVFFALTPTPLSQVVYPRGPIASLPEEFASRRDRFIELDRLQPGWGLELRRKGEGAIPDATFYAPDGTPFKSFPEARRAALAAGKAS
jgi:hypothetical protein